MSRLSAIGRVGLVIFIVVLFIVAGVGVVAIYTNTGQKGISTTSTSYTGSTSTERSVLATSSSVPAGQEYLNVGALYSSFGYPKLTYESYSPYNPADPNFTLQYQTDAGTFQVGTLEAPSINLNQAIGLAATYSKLDPSSYVLAEADFDPGEILNSTLAYDPEWLMFFSQVYQGFWIYGDYGNYGSSVSVTVDALSGSVSNLAINFTSMPTYGEHYQLDINSSQALGVVRSSNISGVPSALMENGTVVSIEPRIVLLGPSSDNLFFLNSLNESLSGQYRLCWLVDLYSTVPRYGYQGTFAVDAESGKLDSGAAQALFPETLFESAQDSLNFSSAKGLTVASETYQINGSVIGRSGMVPVSVPNVLILRPGSTGSIELNFSSTLGNAVNATFSFENPLGNFQKLFSDSLPRGGFC